MGSHTRTFFPLVSIPFSLKLPATLVIRSVMQKLAAIYYIRIVSHSNFTNTFKVGGRANMPHTHLRIHNSLSPCSLYICLADNPSEWWLWGRWGHGWDPSYWLHSFGQSLSIQHILCNSCFHDRYCPLFGLLIPKNSHAGWVLQHTIWNKLTVLIFFDFSNSALESLSSCVSDSSVAVAPRSTGPSLS